MDNLFKQKIPFCGLEEKTEDDYYNIRERRKPQQKKVSFREEGKKTQNWFQRPFTSQMSRVDAGSGGEFETAIAAAAYAMTLKEEENSLNQKKSVEELGGLFIKTKSKGEESMNKLTDRSKISRWFGSKEAKEDGKSSVSEDSSIRKSVTLDQRLREDSAAEHKVTERKMHTTPTIKKTPTFSNNDLNETGRKRSEFDKKQGGQQAPSARTPTVSFSRCTASFSRKGNANVKTTESKADAWEKARMAKIKKGYQKMNVNILEWENEKKVQAKRRLERKERELERRRARTLQEYRNEMSMIDIFAGAARATAEERKRNDEYRTIEKAKKMKLTGKVPNACPCL